MTGELLDGGGWLWVWLWVGVLAAWGLLLALLAHRDYRDTEADVERVLEARSKPVGGEVEREADLPPADPLNGEAGKPGAEDWKPKED